MQWDDTDGEQDKWFEESITVFTELFLDEKKMKVCVNITAVPNEMFWFVFLVFTRWIFEKKSLDQSLKTVILYLQYQLIVTYTGRLKNSFFEGHNPSPCLFSHPLSSPPFLIISYLLQQSSNQILPPAKFSSYPTSTNGTFFFTFNLKLEEKIADFRYFNTRLY